MGELTLGLFGAADPRAVLLAFTGLLVARAICDLLGWLGGAGDGWWH